MASFTVSCSFITTPKELMTLWLSNVYLGAITNKFSSGSWTLSTLPTPGATWSLTVAKDQQIRGTITEVRPNSFAL
jgi:hypothetical protein